MDGALHHRAAKIMKEKVYVVHAYRYGDRERHSYTVGAFLTPEQAKHAAELETDYRGGKYSCEILAFFLNSDIVTSDGGQQPFDTVLQLLPRNLL